jgi:hypothetical protein
MDYLIPNLYRVLQPGRIACIHVKDRIRYSYQNGTSFTTISDFSGQTVMSFEKHGFFLIGKNILQKLGYTRKTTGYYINYEDYKNYISDFPFTSRGPGNE